MKQQASLQNSSLCRKWLGSQKKLNHIAIDKLNNKTITITLIFYSKHFLTRTKFFAVLVSANMFTLKVITMIVDFKSLHKFLKCILIR